MTKNTSVQSRWYCVRTQVKREQIAAQHLRRLDGIQVFSPRLRYRKSTARGRIWWVEPLFPGYVMARFDLESLKRQVSYCTGVRGLVSFGNEVPPIADSFIQDLQEEIRHYGGDETMTTTPTIEIGDEIKVSEGPLQGMAGVVLEVAPASERVKVLLEFLGESRALELDILSLVLPRKPLPSSSNH